jgi:tetratricopeptide (TPR) repeat protein
MLAELPARYALEMRHWNEAAALVAPAGSAPSIAAITYRARVIGNARSGNAAKAREDLQQLEALREAAHKSVAGYPAADRSVNWQEAKAWVEYAEGNLDQALQDMRAAADLEEKDGPAQLAIPAREMLADMLLEKNRTAEALAEYKGALRVAPSRFDGLYGAAHAAELAGKPRDAATFYAELLKNCDGGAHSERPELKQARALVAKR